MIFISDDYAPSFRSDLFPTIVWHEMAESLPTVLPAFLRDVEESIFH